MDVAMSLDFRLQLLSELPLKCLQSARLSNSQTTVIFKYESGTNQDEVRSYKVFSEIAVQLLSRIPLLCGAC